MPSLSLLLLTSGLITPLNKLSLAEQKEAKECGAAPKVRPINSGTLFSKVILSSVLSTPEGKQAASSTLPQQLALGTSRGTEKLIHICRAAHGRKYLIGKNDFQNGFNSISRQAMLNSHAKCFREAVDVFNAFYGYKAPVYVLDSNGELTILSSEQGSRQGCSAGTESFCITLDPLLKRLQISYPEFEFKAFVDDFFPLVPPPPSTPTMIGNNFIYGM